MFDKSSDELVYRNKGKKTIVMGYFLCMEYERLFVWDYSAMIEIDTFNSYYKISL